MKNAARSWSVFFCINSILDIILIQSYDLSKRPALKPILLNLPFSPDTSLPHPPTPLKAPVTLGKIHGPSSHSHSKTLRTKVPNPTPIEDAGCKSESVSKAQESKGSKSVVQVLPVTAIDLDDAGERQDDGHRLDKVGVRAIGEVQRVRAFLSSSRLGAVVCAGGGVLALFDWSLVFACSARGGA
jgi:hypothetical protein